MLCILLPQVLQNMTFMIWWSSHPFLMLAASKCTSKALSQEPSIPQHLPVQRSSSQQHAPTGHAHLPRADAHACQHLWVHRLCHCLSKHGCKVALTAACCFAPYICTPGQKGSLRLPVLLLCH